MHSYNLADLFEIIVDNFADDEALFTAKTTYTYSQLDALANRAAHHFLNQGLAHGDHIGIYAYNRAEWLIAMWGALKIRAVPININYRYTASELRYMCENADLKALVYEAQFSKRVAEVYPQSPQLKTLLVLPNADSTDDTQIKEAVLWDEALQQASDKRDFEQRGNDDLYMLYTGGTTGYPKGTMWRAEDIFFAALQGGNPGGEPIKSPESLASVAREGLRIRNLICAPLMHGGGMWSALLSFLSAGSVVLYEERSFNAHQILQLVQDKSVSSVMLVGDAMVVPIVEALEQKSYDLSALLSIGSGGAVLSPRVKDRLRACLPNTLVLDSLGASEGGSMGAVNDHSLDKAQGAYFSVNPHVTVLDETCRPIKAGSDQIGYLARCGHIPLGYYKDPEKTAQTIRTDANGKRWVMLGDYARLLKDGTVQLLGRASVCINSGGEKIFSEEVEVALKTHPAIKDAVVVPTPHERFGQQVTALISTAGESLDLETLQKYLQKHIAPYKHPKLLFKVDTPPRTPVGKPDYRAATQLAQTLIKKQAV